MATPVSHAEQFVEIVDRVIETYSLPDWHYNSLGGEFDAAVIANMAFFRGAMSPLEDNYRGMPNYWTVAVPAGKLAVVEKNPDETPDEIFRTHTFFPAAYCAAARQKPTRTTRILDSKESEDVIEWLQTPLFSTGIEDIFGRLSPDEQAAIDEAQRLAEEYDQKVLSRHTVSRGLVYVPGQRGRR